MSEDIGVRLLNFTPLNDTDLARLMLDAADEIVRLRHELGMAHADLAMFIDRTAADEIERLRNSLARWRMIAEKLANEVDAQILDRGLELYYEEVNNEQRLRHTPTQLG